MFDGHGGKLAAKKASTGLLEHIVASAAWKLEHTVENLQAAIKAGFISLDVELRLVRAPPPPPGPPPPSTRAHVRAHTHTHVALTKTHAHTTRTHCTRRARSSKTARTTAAAPRCAPW